jgi:hypothetical protein
MHRAVSAETILELRRDRVPIAAQRESVCL